MNKAEVSALLAMLSEVYPRRIGTGDAKRTAALWSMVLADAAPAPVLAAAVGWMRSNKPHPPTPGELLATLEDADRDTPEEAWGRVRSEMQRVGYTGTPELSDRARRAIEAVGGPWETMCRTLQSSEVTALRARFLEAYRGMEDRDQKREAIAQADEILKLAAPIAKAYRLVDATGSEGGCEPSGDCP